MRRLSLGDPVGPNDLAWALRAIKDIENASIEDVEQIFNDRIITGTFTPVRTLNASTATLTDVIAFIATLVSDVQKRGQNRTGA